MWQSFDCPIVPLILCLQPKLLINPYGVEGVLGLGECEDRPFQWPCVSLVTWGTLQIGTLETNKQTINFVSAWDRSWFMRRQTNFNTDVEDFSSSVECRQLFLSRWKWTLFHLGFYLLWDNKRCMNKEELFPNDSFPPDKLMGNRTQVLGANMSQGCISG